MTGSIQKECGNVKPHTTKVAYFPLNVLLHVASLGGRDFISTDTARTQISYAAKGRFKIESFCVPKLKFMVSLFLVWFLGFPLGYPNHSM